MVFTTLTNADHEQRREKEAWQYSSSVSAIKPETLLSWFPDIKLEFWPLLYGRVDGTCVGTRTKYVLWHRRLMQTDAIGLIFILIQIRKNSGRFFPALWLMK